MREYHEDEDSKTKFVELDTVIKQFGHFVFEGNFRIDHAEVASANAAYLAAIFLTGNKDKLERFDEKMSMKEYLIMHPDYNFLNKRMKYIANGEA